MKIHLLSLGCPKNSVDSENLAGLLRSCGAEIVEDVLDAEVGIVNTCGFIQPAVEESVSAILDLELLKEKGALGKIVVVGCLVNRYGEEMKKELPAVDVWARAEEWKRVAEGLGLRGGAPARGMLPETSSWSRYLQVGEGCDTFCSFCTIPSIRGRARSVPLPDLLAQGRLLAEQGAREICLVGQDLTIYGKDLYGAPRILDLLGGLEKELPPEVWIRLLYLHPSRIDEAFIDCISGSRNVLPYLDIPIQHIDETVLRRMNRPDSEGHIRRVFAYAREKDPLFALRTTLITGFPGETEEQFEKVLEFLQEARIDRVGAFVYSPEEGTPAARMKDQVDPAVREERYRRLMELQSGISLERQRFFEGRRLRVLVEEADAEEGYAWGRSYRDAPEVDGLVGIEGGGSLKPGSFVEVLVTDAAEYDLFSEIPRS